VAGVREAAEEITVWVRDPGMGVPRGDLTRIFERFYKVDRARVRGRGGTGLGLSISRHVVDSHGGRIWVESEEGQGSTFFFTIPLAPKPSVPGQGSSAADGPAEAVSETAGPTALAEPGA